VVRVAGSRPGRSPAWALGGSRGAGARVGTLNKKWGPRTSNNVSEVPTACPSPHLITQPDPIRDLPNHLADQAHHLAEQPVHRAIR
jgi:hypothetical protein